MRLITLVTTLFVSITSVGVAAAQSRGFIAEHIVCNSCESCTEAFDHATTVTLGADIVSNQAVCIDIDNVSRRTLDCAGHTIRSTNSAQYQVAIRVSDSEQVDVQDCRIQGTELGIAFHGVVGSTISGSRFEYPPSVETVGISIESSAQQYSRANKISRNTIVDYFGGIWVGPNSSSNSIVDNTTAGRNRTGFSGISIDGFGNSLSRNRAFNNAVGIVVNGPNNTFSGNLVFQNTSYGFWLRGDADDNSLYTNDVVDNGSYDINNEQAGNGNHGDNNTCATFLHWRDYGKKTTGCTYSE